MSLWDRDILRLLPNEHVLWVGAIVIMFRYYYWHYTRFQICENSCDIWVTEGIREKLSSSRPVIGPAADTSQSQACYWKIFPNTLSDPSVLTIFTNLEPCGLIKILIKGGNQSNPHFVWHQKWNIHKNDSPCRACRAGRQARCPPLAPARAPPTSRRRACTWKYLYL